MKKIRTIRRDPRRGLAQTFACLAALAANTTAFASSSTTPLELRCPSTSPASRESSPLFSPSPSAGASQPPAEERLLWKRASQRPARAIAVVVHGLNTKPSKMNSIARTLNEDGYDVLRVGLSGHLGNEKEFKAVKRDIWLKDMQQAYCEARGAAEASKRPLHFVGFSLGALVNIDLMNAYPAAGIKYDRMVLFAPALAVNALTRLVEALNIFGPDYVVFSLANKTYRANENGTPVAAYNALFDSLDRLDKTGIRQNDIPTLMIIDPKDELVSASGLESLLEKNQLDQWALLRISNFDSRLPEGNYHHLIIDEPSLGSTEWKYVQSAMLSHLNGKSFDPAQYRVKECSRTGAWKTPRADYCENDVDPDCSRLRNDCAPVPQKNR